MDRFFLDIATVEILENHLTQALIQYGNADFYPTLKSFKDDYCKKLGDVSEDDYDYESKMAVFNDWYILDAVLPTTNRLIIYDYIVKNVVDIKFHDLLLNVNHSVFEFVGIDKNNQIVLKDLLNCKKIILFKGYFKMAFVKKDLFIGRVMGNDFSAYLRPGLSMLPRQIKGQLVRQGKKLQEEKDLRATKEFLMRLEMLRAKAARYNHLPASKIFVF